MYQKGHLGAALLVYAPFAFVAALVSGPNVALLGGVVAAGLASIPDMDMRIPFVPHRGPTHTVWFAVLVGIPIGLAGGLFGLQAGLLPAIGLLLFGFVVGTATILSHLAADALTPMGIQPFTPWRSTKYTWDLVKAANPIANYALLGIGGTAAVAAGYAGLLLRSMF